MSHTPDQSRTRRKFLKMLGASPFIAGSSVLSGSLANLLRAAPNQEKRFLSWLETLQQSEEVISSPDQALNVMDFEPAARKAIPPAHWGYLAHPNSLAASRGRDQHRHVTVHLRHQVGNAHCAFPRGKPKSVSSRWRTRRRQSGAEQGQPHVAFRRGHNFD